MSLSDALQSLPRISLSELDNHWNQASRHDFKFILSFSELESLITSIAEDLQILEIDGRTQFQYETTYFDTSDYQMYRQHFQAKAKRLKIRERTYVDVGRSQLEIKRRLSSSKSEKCLLTNSQGLNSRAEQFLVDNAELEVIRNGSEKNGTFDSRIPIEELKVSAVTDFSRTTLLNIGETEKLTIDFNLLLKTQTSQIEALEDVALVEIKAQNARSNTVMALRESGVRATNFSKYASAIDLLVSSRPKVHSTRALKKVFGPAI